MLTFALQHSAETMKLWPHEFTLYARFKLGKICEIELEAHGEFETTLPCTAISTSAISRR